MRARSPFCATVTAAAVPRQSCARVARWLSTTTTAETAPSPPADSAPSLQALDEAMTRRPAKFIPDYLSPMPSHLLSTLLADLTTSSSSSSGSSGRAGSSPTIQTPPRALPQGHHLVYFPLQTPASGLAADGADGDHEPAATAGSQRRRRRRLWAGGEVVFREGWRRRLRLDGRAWACSEAVESVRRVAGGAGGGDKVFVHVWRRYGLGHEREREAWDVEERRTLVFMPKSAATTMAASSSSSSETSEPRPRPTSSQRLVKYAHPSSLAVEIRPPSPAHLFHFSALTLNAHAIHIDPRYAADADGHRALLVHGPLALALMLRVLAVATDASGSSSGRNHADDDDSSLGPPVGCVRRLTYRNYAPLYVGEAMTVGIRRLAAPRMWDVWVEGPEGALAVKGTAEVEAE